MKLKDKLARLSTGFVGPGRTPSPSTEPAAEPAYELPLGAPVARAQPTADVPTSPLSDPGGSVSERLDRIASLRSQLEALRSRPLRSRDSDRPLRRVVREEDAEEALTRLAAPPVDRTLPGEQVKTPHGLLQRMRVTFDEDHCHGHAPVVRGAEVCAQEVALLALDPSLASVDLSRALFIDTETTGLAGGSGTLPFLIGLAWFEDRRLVVDQLVLERPGREVPMLECLAERLRQASVIVSYNGKSFDWPLLRTRFILNRVAAPPLNAHLDLLHCARRVFKSRLGSVRLVFLEQELLGFERIDDIAGEQIPERYFGYLRGRIPGSALKPVLDHNRSDLVALPALLGEIVRRFRGEHAHTDACDQLGFAHVAARAAAPERAIALAHAAVAADLRGEFSASAHYLVGALKQRQGELTAAIEAFERAVEASITRSDAARAHLALAKLHEHKTKQLERALDHAQHTSPCEGPEASARRASRLVERIERRTNVEQRTDKRERTSPPLGE